MKLPNAVPKPRKSRKRVPKPIQRSPMTARGKRTAKSGGSLFYGPEYVDLDYRAWIRTQPCHVRGKRTGYWIDQRRPVLVVPAHVKSRGSSGKDAGNLIPLDALLHEEQHRIGWPAFQRKYGFDRFAVAAGYERRYRAEMSVSPKQGGITG